MALPSYYNRRVEDGTYREITQQIKNMGKECLSFAEYGSHFIRNVSSNGNYFYTNMSDSREFKVLIFGEICRPTLGTAVSAKGNHWPGPNSLVSAYLI
jgi:archaellum component FlaG (FlaF/FlaG flagellin family)